MSKSGIKEGIEQVEEDIRQKNVDPIDLMSQEELVRAHEFFVKANANLQKMCELLDQFPDWEDGDEENE